MTEGKGQASTLNMAVAEYLGDYTQEFDGGAHYTPNDRERLMIEDAILGWEAQRKVNVRMTDKIDVAGLLKQSFCDGVAWAVGSAALSKAPLNNAAVDRAFAAITPPEVLASVSALLEAAEAKAGLEVENARLREALRPFAEELYVRNHWPDNMGGPETMASAGMVRAARAALSENPQ